MANLVNPVAPTPIPEDRSTRATRRLHARTRDIKVANKITGDRRVTCRTNEQTGQGRDEIFVRIRTNICMYVYFRSRLHWQESIFAPLIETGRKMQMSRP